MTVTPEQMRVQLEKDRLEAEREAAAAAEAARLGQPHPLPAEEESEEYVTGNDAIWKAYTKKFPEKEEEARSSGVLTFPSHAEAIRFFTEQAQAGLNFLCQRIKNGNRLDDYVLSIGDGELMTGTAKALIEALDEKLNGNALSAEARDNAIAWRAVLAPNPTAEYRKRRVTREEPDEASSAPTP